jgi:hypothetical protein
MRASVTTFWTPKDGSTDAEYEDASACLPEPTQDGDVVGESLRVAIADGASESLLAGRWAQLLTTEFMEAKITETSGEREFAAVSGGAARKWDETLARYKEERETAGKPIKWYEEPGLDRGAYATLIVAHLSETQGGDHVAVWQAVALGDSCLFQVRDDALVTAFPLSVSADFGIQPDLLGSRGQDEDLVAERARLSSGTCDHDDTIFICTDALAAWFLNRSEAGEQPWTDLIDLGTEGVPTFPDWVAAQRSVGGMRNDDVTLVRVDIW